MSLASEVAATIRARIDAGELAPGDRLPPVRETAATEHVSAAVAGEAYAMLAREGRVVARVGRGTYVSRASGGNGPLVEVGARRRPPTPSATLELQERLAAAQRPGSINLSAGVPVVDEEIAAAVATELEAVVRSEGTRLFAYGHPRGDPELRELVTAAWRARGYPADPESVLVTTSGQQAIDLAVRALVEPGDAVLCETPTYAGAIDALVAARARIVPLPADAHGLQIDGVEEAVRTERPRLLFCNPTGNNATGTVLSQDRRERLAAIAAESGLVVIEDDTGAELVHDGPVPPPIAACDPEAPVVLVKSYAKTVLPGLRLGVLLAPPALDRRVIATKLVADRYTSPPLVHALARYLSRPEAVEHLERVRLLYRARRDAFLRNLERRLGGRAGWLAPQAGFNLWLRLGERVTEEEVFARAADRGVIVSPGQTYVPPGVPTAHLRLSFSTATEAEADRGLARLAMALRDITAPAGRGRTFEDDGLTV
jgi:DNA-binding transcriptional MocR family regulator